MAGVALDGGLSILLGWRLHRSQERIKRDEELAAGMRKLRVDALVKVLEAIGRYYNDTTRLTGWRKAGALNDAQQAFFDQDFRRKEDATRTAVNALADTWFLLGDRVGATVRQRFSEMMRAETHDTDEEADRAARALLVTSSIRKPGNHNPYQGCPQDALERIKRCLVRAPDSREIERRATKGLP